MLKDLVIIQFEEEERKMERPKEMNMTLDQLDNYIHAMIQEKLYKKDMEIGNLQSIILELGGHWEPKKKVNENECPDCGGKLYTSDEHGHKEKYCVDSNCYNTPPF